MVIYLFAYTVIMFKDVVMGPYSGIVMVMTLLFALTAVIAYMFSIGSASCCICDKDFI